MLTANSPERLLPCAETQKSRAQQPGRADGWAGRGQQASQRQRAEPGTDGALLPAFDIGRVVNEPVAEGSCVARLTAVRRQAADSEIQKLASQVREGMVPELPAWGGEADGRFIVSPDQGHAVQPQLRAQGELLAIVEFKAAVISIYESAICESRPDTPAKQAADVEPCAHIGGAEPGF